jgi:hypothetical protein
MLPCFTAAVASIAAAAAAAPLCVTAELVSGIMAWFKLEGKPVNKADIRTLFDAFMERVARWGASVINICY